MAVCSGCRISHLRANQSKRFEGRCLYDLAYNLHYKGLQPVLIQSNPTIPGRVIIWIPLKSNARIAKPASSPCQTLRQIWHSRSSASDSPSAFSPESIALVPSLLAPLVLFMDLLHMIGLF